MKKVKILVVAVTVALMLMGTGYALWNQSLAFNFTGDAGNFGVSIYDAQAIETDFVTAGALVADDEKSADFTIENAFPGAVQSFDVSLENAGTIPAKFVSIGVSGRTTTNWTMLGKVLVQVYDGSGVLLGGKWLDSDGTIDIPDQTFAVGDTDVHYTVRVTFDSSIGNDAQNATFGFTLSPNFVQ